MKLNFSQKELKGEIIKALKEQGFRINPHLEPIEHSKIKYKQIHQKAKFEQVSLHKKFLAYSIKKARNYCRDGYEINPEKISLELRVVKCGSFEEVIFKWWNLIWWSIPYQHSYGRQMRFLLWDKAHNSPFGLITLQSPVLKMSIRDKALGIPNDELDIWINRSMNAQRVGALPPYNELLGGKLVALALTSNEIREAYKKKYRNYISIIKGRKLKPELLFITTTSAFGKSSMYNRIKYNGEIVAESLGYTHGSGTFHIPEKLYREILIFLSRMEVNVNRGFGYGPSRKLRLISLGFRYLGLPSFEHHGIKREFYLFSLVNNLKEVIQCGQMPVWIDRPFDILVDYWKKRWAIPRSERMPRWRDFKAQYFFGKVEAML